MSVSIGTRFFQSMILLAFLALAVFFPYLWFGVVPFATDDVVPQAEIDRLLAGKNLPDYYAEPLAPIPAEELEAQKVAFTWCRFCHTLEKGGENRVGPNLYRIVGKPAAVAPHFVYSQAFIDARNNGLVWTPENLAAFIADTAGFVPHNRMRYPPMIGYELSAERDRQMLEYLMRMTR
ncbi:MAG: hypothetical protein KJ040_11460 [Gammaproteobacteria bacterium]|nr:hypothetical protein [Gammaproteobacteria bacterium]